MDNNSPEINPRAAAAEKLAAVVVDLEQAAANAPTPTERLLLMRQWRKVNDAHDALTKVEGVNTQSIPVQVPATIQQPVAAKAPAAVAAQPAALAATGSKPSRSVLILGLAPIVWLVGAVGAATLNSRGVISPDLAILWYQLGVFAFVCAVLAVVFGHQWRAHRRRALASGTAAQSMPGTQVGIGMVFGYMGLGVAALFLILLVGFIFIPWQW